MSRFVRQWSETAYVESCVAAISQKIHSQIEIRLFFAAFALHESTSASRMLHVIVDSFAAYSTANKISGLYFINEFFVKHEDCRMALASRFAQLADAILSRCKKQTFELCSCFLRFAKAWAKQSALLADAFVYISKVLCAYSGDVRENRLGKAFIQYATQQHAALAREKQQFAQIKASFVDRLKPQIDECCAKIESLLQVMFDAGYKPTIAADETGATSASSIGLVAQKSSDSRIEIEIQTQLTTSRDDPFLLECVLEAVHTLKRHRSEVSRLFKGLLELRFFVSDLSLYYEFKRCCQKIDAVTQKCALAPNNVFEEGTLLEEVPI